MSKHTCFDEGRSAGYFGIGREKNPYRKGWQEPLTEHYADGWDAGYAAGEQMAEEERKYDQTYYQTKD